MAGINWSRVIVGGLLWVTVYGILGGAAMLLFTGREFLLELERMGRPAWTTSSEMIGEIGIAIRSIQRKNGNLPPEVDAAFDFALSEIHRVWPAILEEAYE